MKIDAVERHANTLLDLLVDCGPLNSTDICTKLGWRDGRFRGALKYARDVLCPVIGVSIPFPTPEDGWLYQVTTDWRPVEAGAAYSLGQAESRLKGVLRDVRIVKPHLDQGSRDWRRANFLDKHLSHILGTLEEINDG